MIDIPSLLMGKAMGGGGSGGGDEPKLPSEYQEVEYLSFTPHAGILVNIPQNAAWEIEVTANSLPSSPYGRVAFGYRGTSSENNDFGFQINANSSTFNGWIRTNSGNMLKESPITLTEGVKATYGTAYYGMRTTAFIGRYCKTGNASDYLGWKGNICRLIGRNPFTGELLACFIACYRKSDNTMGYYDAVAKVFYYEQDLTGGGSITKGPDVT